MHDFSLVLLEYTELIKVLETERCGGAIFIQSAIKFDQSFYDQCFVILAARLKEAIQTEQFGMYQVIREWKTVRRQTMTFRLNLLESVHFALFSVDAEKFSARTTLGISHVHIFFPLSALRDTLKCNPSLLP